MGKGKVDERFSLRDSDKSGKEVKAETDTQVKDSDPKGVSFLPAPSCFFIFSGTRRTGNRSCLPLNGRKER